MQTNAVWSPDGKYLVFARAEARAPYPEGGKGGKPEPIAGASRNGMSNTFPNISPDGRWIVYVQARNGLLMRPDSQLYIVPARGGKARRLRSNLAPMNSWHSFSPNGRWLVFSSKSRSPYTQMYLTHLDKDGNASPAILVDNTTAANRAVNIPEFVNIPADGLLKIDTPATDFYRISDRAWDLAKKGQYDPAIAEWKKALELSPENDRAHNNVGMLLAGVGKFDEAILHFEKTLDVNPEYPDAHSNLGVALAGIGKPDQAIAEFEKALEINRASAEAHNNLGRTLAGKGRLDEAIPHFRQALDVTPDSASVHANLGRALAETGGFDEAIVHFQKALEAGPGVAEIYNGLAVALVKRGRVDEAITNFLKALEINPEFADAHFNLGDTLYYLKGNAPEALRHWRIVLRLDPNHVPVLNQTAWVLATHPDASLRDGAQAVGLAERAVELSGGRDPAILDTLAAAYAEAGRFSEAVEITNRNLTLAVQRNNRLLAGTLKVRIALYEARTPFRDENPH